MFGGKLKFSIFIFVSRTTSSVAYVSRKYFTTSLQEDGMPSGLSKDFLSSNYRGDTKERAAKLVIECFTHRIAVRPWITFESNDFLRVTRKLRMEIMSVVWNVFALIRIFETFLVRGAFLETLSE